MADTQDGPKVGELYNTDEGQTVFVDPKTNHLFIFEKVKIKPVVKEPTVLQPANIDNSKKSHNAATAKALLTVLSAFEKLGGIAPSIITPTELPMATIIADQDGGELGKRLHYILIPEGKLPLSVGGANFNTWVAEWEKGHHPDYTGYVKYMILKEQFDWLSEHKAGCSLVAWMDQACPIYASVACQNHAVSMRPVFEKGASAEVGKFAGQEVKIVPEAAHVLAEEREI